MKNLGYKFHFIILLFIFFFSSCYFGFQKNLNSFFFILIIYLLLRVFFLKFHSFIFFIFTIYRTGLGLFFLSLQISYLFSILGISYIFTCLSCILTSFHNLKMTLMILKIASTKYMHTNYNTLVFENICPCLYRDQLASPV